MEELKWIAIYLMVVVFTAGFCVAIATFFSAKGQGEATSRAVDGIARQPEASGKIFMPLMLGLVLMETLTLYALLVSLLIIFIFGIPAADVLLKKIIPKLIGG